jgi:uncharacterized membrane protein
MGKMLKNNKLKLVISSLVILLPMLLGVIFWDSLTEKFEGNWNYGVGKTMSVFGLPLIFLVFHWIMIFALSFDKNNKTQSPKAVGMLFWVIPVISFFCQGLFYMLMLEFNTELIYMLSLLGIGLCFILVGNYMPKFKRNYTMGIKMKWTFSSEKNWNATHRLSGKVWVLGGFVIMLASFLPITASMIASFVVFIAMLVIPTVYSWSYYKKELASGEVSPNCANNYFCGKSSKAAFIVTVVVVAVIFAIVGVLMLVGDVEISFREASFEIGATFNGSIEIEYSEIDEIEFREDFDKGVRVMGFGSPRLFVGNFRNNEFGGYTLYSYTKCPAAVVIRSGEKILVVNLSDAAATRELYNTISEKLDK